jgi:hypothetical protein
MTYCPVNPEAPKMQMSNLDMLKLEDFLQRYVFAGRRKVAKLSTDYSRTRGRERVKTLEFGFCRNYQKFSKHPDDNFKGK